MPYLKPVLVVVLIAAALFAIDRLFLYFESRGWLYWRKKKASPGAKGVALLELQSILEPQKVHQIEQMRQGQVEEDENGDPIDRDRFHVSGDQ